MSRKPTKLSLSEGVPESPAGGVILVHQAKPATGKQKPNRSSEGIERLAAATLKAGLEVIRVQWPPQKRAHGNVRLAHPSLEKAIVSAIERLTNQCGPNGHRIALVAEREAATPAVIGARAAWQLRSFVFLSGRLSLRAKEVLDEWQNNPVLCLVSSEDKKALRDMTEVYFTSKHPDTDIQVFEGLGLGAELVTSWASKFPAQEPLEDKIAAWLRRELSLVGRAREVSFMTEDGWKIFGNLLLPDLNGEKAPGVILLHSGRSDRYVFVGLERLLVRAGFAVLNIDWRGRGKSVNKGKYFDLSKEERANGKLDARAAIDFLVAQPGVDSHRIGLVGIIHGAEHAVRGSIGDDRVKALALLTGYVPIDEKERAYLTSGKVHVMYVSGRAHTQVTKTMRRLYEETPDKLVRFQVFEGGAIGYQLFELDENFEPAIVEWLRECLFA